MTYSIERNGQSITLTEDEVHEIVKTAQHEERKTTCRLLTKLWLENLEIIDNAMPAQTGVLMSNAMPDAEIERMTNLYEARASQETSEFETWTAILTEQLLQSENPVGQFMTKCIQDKLTPEEKFEILSSRTLNPHKITNFHAFITGLPMRLVIKLWNAHQMLQKLA